MSSNTKTTTTTVDATPLLVPKLQFPEFRGAEGWAQKRLIDTADRSVKWSFIGGPFGSNLKSSDYVPDGVRIIQLQNIGDGEFFNEYQIFTTPQKADELLSNNIYPGEIIMSKMGDPVGRACLIPEYHDRYVMCSDGIRLVVDEKENEKYFIYSLINSPFFRGVVEKTATGSTRKRIGLDELKSLPMWLPKKPEQQKIAECLSSVDELMAAQARKVDALKTHKKGLMQRLFPREGETQPRLRFPEFQNAGEWEVSELGSVSDVRDGTHDSPAFFPTGRPLVTSKNLRPDGTLDLENVSLIAEEDYEQINKRSKVTGGDILFGMIGTIGNPVLIKSEGFAIKNVALIKELGPLSNEFLVQLLQSGYVAAIFAVLNTGNSQKFIALRKIRGLPVPVPSLPEQQRIALCLGSLDTLITLEAQKLEALNTHKKGLMQKLFPSPDAVKT